MLEFGRRLRQIWWRPTVAEEVDNEVEFHLEMRIRELIGRGMTAEAARAEALARLGDQAAFRRTLRRLGKERNRMTERREWLSEFRQDVRFAGRSLGRQPGFLITALLTLGLGIGATTAIFSFLYAVVLKPLSIPQVERVMNVGDGQGDGSGRYSISVGNYVDYQRQTRAFQSMGAAYWTNFNLAVDGSPERVSGVRADAAFFGVLRVPPAIGRFYTAEEDSPGAGTVALLSDGLWRRRFGADTGVVGRSITIDGVGHLVVGIMPRGFPLAAEELWVPTAFTPEQRAQHDEHYLEVYARLADGVTPAQAVADQNRIARQLAEAYPLDDQGLVGAVEPMMVQYLGAAPERLGILFGAVVVVLLIGCVNVANLLLARGAARERELAVRAALGAGRRRIVRQLVTENLVLALGAGVLGLGIAAVVVRLLLAFAPTTLPRIAEARLDGIGVAFALALSIASVLVFGLVPAIRTAGKGLAQTLREGSKGSSGAARDWFRRGLVSAEIALALILLAGAGLLIRTAIHLGQIDPGFRAEGVVTARVGLPEGGYPEWEQVTRAFTRLHEGLGRIPGAQSAALGSQVPMGPGGGQNGLIPEGRELALENAIDSQLRLVTPGYLSTMGIPLERGRDFTAEDRRGATRVMIVSKRLAELAWPGQDPIGKRIACCEGSDNDPMFKEVIGVAGNVRSAGLDQEVRPEFYLPIGQTPPDAWNWIRRTMTLVVRAKAPMAMVPGIRMAAKAVDPAVPVYAVATMDERIVQSLAQSRFNTRLLVALGLVGLVLAAIGIYGVIGYFVARQTRELGIRIALGASRNEILRLVLGQGLRPVLIGIGVGIGGGLLLARLLTSQLRGVGSADPVTFGAVAAFLLIVALLASLGPARRAARVSPATAMREE